MKKYIEPAMMIKKFSKERVVTSSGETQKTAWQQANEAGQSSVYKAFIGVFQSN